MIWKTANLKAIQSLFIGEEGAVGLINGFKLDLMDPISLDVTLPRGTAPSSRPVNQVISLWACSVRSKRRHGEYAGEHSASLCAPSILAHWGAIIPSAGTITSTHFSNEVSANVARQKSFRLETWDYKETRETLRPVPTADVKEDRGIAKPGLANVWSGLLTLIEGPTTFMNRKTMKNKNNNPFFVSSIQSCNTNRRTAGRLRSAGLNTTAVLSVILGCSATAALAGLAVIGVNLALISAAVLLIYIIFGCLASRSVTNCHRIQ